MSKKLMSALSTLSVQTKSIEEKIAQANAESKEKVEAKVAQAKVNLDAQKAEFIAKVEKLKNLSLKESLKSKMTQMQANDATEKANVENTIGELIHSFEVERATAEYREAFHYAESCVAFTLVALADVELTMLKAINTKLKLVDLIYK
jgi:hypothetical protein